MKNKNILLGVTGSIAAFKCPELIRLLKEKGANVKVIMTEGAATFVTPMTLQALSGNPVYQAFMNPENEAVMSHIELARWADLVLIVPITAHFIAKLAVGFADDLLSTLCLATHVPIALVPAMNKQMWLNEATQNNLSLLQQRKVRVIGPVEGLQACGETGFGRMIDPEILLSEIINLFNKPMRLSGKKVMITAGPTQEAIDPVRYLSNYSSGKMGYAIAEAAAEEGAEVTLISGPTALETPFGVKRINVISAQNMYDAVMAHVSNCHIFIGVAAVADYRPETIKQNKLKKLDDKLQLNFIRNPDILMAVSQLKFRPIMVGFAAETENFLENARQKLKQKKLDMIIANGVSKDKGFQQDENEVTLITETDTISLPLASKKVIAGKIIDYVVAYSSRWKTCTAEK